MNVELWGAACLPGGGGSEEGVGLGCTSHLCLAGGGDHKSGDCSSNDLIPEF